jgi:hypothetical protein
MTMKFNDLEKEELRSEFVQTSKYMQNITFSDEVKTFFIINFE